ncbi:hypothetical protein KJ359_008568 [Pestalotiopsis sp. 9143b]|nr:hypothetical protein KJ359_008568 [Pestalotiopsis sp. 9143b]
MEPLEYQATVCEGCNDSGEITRSLSIWHGESQAEKDWYLIHRAHLHTALKDLATAEHGEGKPAKLFLGSRLVNLDPEAGEIELSTGEKFTGDLIVGADGVHSWSRTYVDPDARPFAAGKSCFRWLNPFSQLQGEELTKAYSELTGHIVEWAAPDRRMIYYPCANHTISNFAGFVPMDEVSGLSTGWTGAGSKPALLKAFETFGPGPQKILEQAPEEDLKLWTLLDMKPLDKWYKGRLTLLGDAAHPFMPFMGQGGAMAIEDAATLAALLRPGTASRDVPERLKMYQECRQDRANRIQEFTRKNGRDMGNVDLPRPSCKESPKQDEVS